MTDMLRPVGLPVLLSLVCAACGGGGGPADGGDLDASAGDAAMLDGALTDEGTDAASDDGAVPDSALTDEGVDAPPTHARLTLVFDGDGHGTVTSVDPVLMCSASCSADFPIGAVLNMVATREDDSTFNRFEGPCTGIDGSCELTLDADVTVHVRFDAIHNYMFVTSERFDPATFESAANADELCNEAAEAGDERLHGRTYVAWLSDATSDARDRLGDASGWQRLDGLPFIASREAMLGSGARVLYPPRLDENGADVLPPADTPDPNSRPLYYATGILTSGQRTSNCMEWSDEASSFIGGTADSAGAGWTNELGSACSIDVRLLCLGNDYATPFTLPPPVPTGATRAVFATSVPESLMGDGLAALDARCQSEAGAAGLTGTYLALLATPGASALSRFTDEGGPWVRMDGVVAVLDPAAFLVSGVPDSALGTLGRDGQPASGSYATGAPSLTAPGTNETTCSGYTSVLTADAYSFSHAGRTYPVAMGTFGIPCSSFQSMVCMAQ